jgi:predicted peptidase
MTVLSMLALVAALQQQPTNPGTYTLSFAVPDLEPMRYALTIPRGYNGRDARPLILALHPGGQRFPGYGASFAQQIIAPGLSSLGAIIVAPDVPTRSWTDDISDRAILGLVKAVMTDYKVDPARVMVVGFSLGGRGAWFHSSRHTDIFKAAIVMAGSTGDEPIEKLATVPTYVIHSRDDEVVEFAPAEKVVKELQQLKRTIEFEPLSGPTHFTMGGYIDSLARGGRWVSDRWRK